MTPRARGADCNALYAPPAMSALRAFNGSTAIVGIGWTAFARNSGTTVLNLAAEASLNAIRDAGLEPRDIDGLISYRFFDDTASPTEVAQALGIADVGFQCFDTQGGGWSCAAIVLAAMAVHTGICRNVLVYRAMNGRSEVGAVRRNRPGLAVRSAQYTVPFGAAHAAASLGQLATAHMARYGTTSLDFAHLAVRQREHALLNTKSVMREPLSIEQHQASPWFIYPFRRFDCCLETDNAVAVVVSSLDRARDMRQAPVQLLAAVGGSGTAPSLETSNGVFAAPRLYGSAGRGPGGRGLGPPGQPARLLS